MTGAVNLKTDRPKVTLIHIFRVLGVSSEDMALCVGNKPKFAVAVKDI